MSVCRWCKRDTSNPRTESCIVFDVKFRDGTKAAPIPFTPLRRLSETEWMAQWRQSHEMGRQLKWRSCREDSEAKARKRCAEYQKRWDRCHDCGIKAGGFHHPGCDAEECPRCHGQLISCGCLAAS